MPKPLNTSTFIERCKKVHNNKYDYSETVYVNAKSKIKIKCSIHGLFECSPDNHYRGKGCPKCAGRSLSDSDFIELCKAVHGEMYDYSKTDYKLKNEKVTIKCSIHGDFRQYANVHLSGSGCPKCSGKGYSKNEIIQLFKENLPKHYRLNSDIYKSEKWRKKRNLVKIYCERHNYEWDVIATPSFTKKAVCDYCYREKMSETQRSSFEDIRDRIERIHNSYKVPRQTIRNQHSRIHFICNKHGKQTGIVLNLLNSQGCPVCGQLSRNKKQTDSLNDVKLKIESKWPHISIDENQEYGFSHHSLIEFRCSKHGKKISTPNAILTSPYGCPDCGQESTVLKNTIPYDEVLNRLKDKYPDLVFLNSKYKNTRSKIHYICPKHGEQATQAMKLLGQHEESLGCPDCNLELRDNYSDKSWAILCGKRVAKVYWLKMTYKDISWYKFGRTFHSVNTRFYMLEKYGIEYEIIKIITGEPYYIAKLERRVHSLYSKRRFKPPVDFGGGETECYTII